jgi:Uma2 family endonuclease
MPRTRGPLKNVKNLKDLLSRLGEIPPERIRLYPSPGTATEKDLLHVLDHENVPCELIDGVLVEKPMGAKESFLAIELGFWIRLYLQSHPLGVVFGADATLRIMPHLIRLPDLSFVSASNLPGGLIPDEPVPDLVPDLAVEVLSIGNTRAEMLRKRREFFFAGTSLIWIVDPNKRTVDVYDAPDRFITYSEGDHLIGGDLLPGFAIEMRELFARVPKPADSTPKKKRKKP